MLNQFPLWKNLLVLIAIVIGALYALPNLYGEDPSVQISPARGVDVSVDTQNRVEQVLKSNQINPIGLALTDDRLLIRFPDTEMQLEAYDRIKQELGRDYIVALNLAPKTPDWLLSLSAAPMYLGLDLRGGVHFLLEVDMDAAEKQAVERYVNDARTVLRDQKIRYLGVLGETEGVRLKFRTAEIRDQAETILSSEFRDLEVVVLEDDETPSLMAKISQQERLAIRKFALEQNIITLRNRVNELGVAEPVIQRQGDSRIVVQLPGVQDTARAKEILGATATLEFHMVDVEHDAIAASRGRVPLGSSVYPSREGGIVLLEKRVIVTGDQITDAKSGIDNDSGSPMVSISLDGTGAKKMSETTRVNIGKPMAVVFIENKTLTEMVNGEEVRTRHTLEEVINVATIRGHFSNRFQITGLDSPAEARDLALLLRAGALAAPISIIEERTIGPSLGKDNIDQGFNSVIIGFCLVLVLMAFYYKIFGLVADVALGVNLIFIVALLSLLQATLTLPGIAGIVLTVGMAVDANVLIFERIREELRLGNSPQASIHAGYEKALSTIADANITTLIAAIILFGFGTGPIKGFAVTLSLGIVTSMFTAIIGTRAAINLIYGGRRIEKLAI